MGLRLVADEGARVIHHPLGDVGVMVERHHDGDAVPDHLANGLQQEPFDVVFLLRRRGAVQRQEDAVERERLPQALDESRGEELEGLFG